MSHLAHIHSFPCGPLATNTYVLFCSETNKAAIIDPGIESSFVVSPYLEKRGLTPEMILLTHSHWDHTADVHTLKQRYEIPTYIHPEDAPNLEKPGIDGLPLLFPIPPVIPDHLICAGDTISLGQFTIHVLHTPGHTPGGVCFYLPEESILFSGDTLFQGSIGNLSLPTAEPRKMWPSLEQLAKLPKETKIYPGHGEPTSIGEESWLSNAKKIFGQ